jgi:hypothetical protein
MNMTRVLAASFAAAVFALPTMASAQSPTIIIINPSPAGGYGGWGPGTAPTAWGAGCGWGGGCGGGWSNVGCGGGCGAGWGGGWRPGWNAGWGGGACIWTGWGWRC